MVDAASGSGATRDARAAVQSTRFRLPELSAEVRKKNAESLRAVLDQETNDRARSAALRQAIDAARADDRQVAKVIDVIDRHEDNGEPDRCLKPGLRGCVADELQLRENCVRGVGGHRHLREVKPKDNASGSRGRRRAVQVAGRRREFCASAIACGTIGDDRGRPSRDENQPRKVSRSYVW